MVMRRRIRREGVGRKRMGRKSWREGRGETRRGKRKKVLLFTFQFHLVGVTKNKNVYTDSGHGNSLSAKPISQQGQECQLCAWDQGHQRASVVCQMGRELY